MWGDFQHHNCSCFIYPFESGNYGKGNNYKKGISHKQKELFNWNKKYLQQFLRWFILVNSKNLSIRVLNWLKHGARNNFYWIT